MTKYTPYLAVVTPNMNKMFTEYMRVFEGKFGSLTPEQKELMELAYKTGAGRGITADAGEGDKVALLVESGAFSRHQIAASRQEPEKEDVWH